MQLLFDVNGRNARFLTIVPRGGFPAKHQFGADLHLHMCDLFYYDLREMGAAASTDLPKHCFTKVGPSKMLTVIEVCGLLRSMAEPIIELQAEASTHT